MEGGGQGRQLSHVKIRTFLDRPQISSSSSDFQLLFKYPALPQIQLFNSHRCPRMEAAGNFLIRRPLLMSSIFLLLTFISILKIQNSSHCTLTDCTNTRPQLLIIRPRTNPNNRIEHCNYKTTMTYSFVSSQPQAFFSIASAQHFIF